MFLYWSDVLSLLLPSSKKSGESETTPTPPTTPTSPAAPTSPTTPTLPPRVTSFPPPPVTTDSVRNKCRELLVAALQTDGEDGFILCFHNLETSLTSSVNEEHFKVRRIKKKKKRRNFRYIMRWWGLFSESDIVCFSLVLWDQEEKRLVKFCLDILPNGFLFFFIFEKFSRVKLEQKKRNVSYLNWNFFQEK